VKGWHGLIAAATYLALAPETKLLIVDDGMSIRGVWSAEHIYPNLSAQVGHGLFEYSFYPMKNVGLTKDRYIPGSTIHEYLRSFAEDHGLVDRILLDQFLNILLSLLLGLISSVGIRLPWERSTKRQLHQNPSADHYRHMFGSCPTSHVASGFVTLHSNEYVLLLNHK
jgi:hypothetical protein